MIPAPPDARVAFEAWRSRVTEGAWADEWHLRSMLRVLRPNLDTSGLEAFAATCAGPIDVLAVENNRDEHLPVLRRYDGRGNRIEAVDHHPTYHEIGRLAYRSGMMSRYAEPGNELETLGLVYLFAQQGEAGHACPMACTAGLIKILQSAGNPRPDWLERLLDPNYDTHFHGAQFMTEVQGGSDVGANTLRAVDAGDGWATLHGEKWFCSVIDANLYLVTARPEGAKPGTGGLSAYVVPRVLDDGRVNDLNIRRLKYKLGTRSMASAELDFVGARALRVGDFKLVLERVIDTSRLYNAVCSSGMIQRASREAWAYATNRRAFGQPILAFPTVARIVARLRTEAVGARALTLLLADLADREATSPGVRSDTEAGAVRMLVNLNKLWTSFHGTSAARDAIEVLGGQRRDRGVLGIAPVAPRQHRL
jgi:acyl-CoA dehydrogenase